MKPRIASRTGHHTDRHGCQMDSLHAVRAKCGRDGIVSAARSQSTVRDICHALSAQLENRRIVVSLQRQSIQEESAI